ncbi:hypothetical protein GN956_G17012 [Arapaima gigas]
MRGIEENPQHTMSSHAAAAISAMITSQVYPQLPRTRPRTTQWSRSQDLWPVAPLSKNKIIGFIQVGIGIVVMVTFFILELGYSDVPKAAEVTSVIGFIVYILSGLVSAFAKGESGIKASIFTNCLSLVAAFISIIIYSLCFQCCSGNMHFCSNNILGSILWTFLFLSILDLFVAALIIVHCSKAIRQKQAQKSSTSRLEGQTEREPQRQNAAVELYP